MIKGSQNCFVSDVATADRTKSREWENSHKRQNNLNLEYTYKTWIWWKGRCNGETKERKRFPDTGKKDHFKNSVSTEGEWHQ